MSVRQQLISTLSEHHRAGTTNPVRASAVIRVVADALESDEAYYAITDGKPGQFEVVKSAAKWLRRSR